MRLRSNRPYPVTALLEKEYKYYLCHLDKFCEEYLHRFVLIKKDRVVGFYDTYAEALKAGVNGFGNVPFFIKEVEREEAVHSF